MSAKIPKLEPLELLTMDEKLHLVNIMQAYPELWDERHPAYKDNAKRTKAWNVITGIMQDSFDKQYQDTTVSHVGKPEGLLSKKAEAHQGASAHSSGSAASANIAVKMKSWPLYEAMSFLSASTDQGDRFCTTFKVAEERAVNDDDDVDIFCDEAASQEVSLQGSASSSSPSPTSSRERSQASTPSSWRPTSSTFTNVRPLQAIAKKEGLRKIRQVRGAVDELTDALKEEGNKLDRYELLGLTLASKLRALRELDPVASEEWMLKTEEFMIPLSRCIFELHKAPSI